MLLERSHLLVSAMQAAAVQQRLKHSCGRRSQPVKAAPFTAVRTSFSTRHDNLLHTAFNRPLARVRATTRIPHLRSYCLQLDGSAVVGDHITTSSRIASNSDFQQVARLRAEAFYENERSRFVETYRKQFAANECESLVFRTSSRGGRPPECECMVLVDESGSVQACIDIRPPKSAGGDHPKGVPLDDPAGAYLLNVVVAQSLRGKGLGGRLMRQAMSRAVELWGAQALYTHVEADNEVAFRLYASCGFTELSADAPLEGASMLGKLVLLRAAAPPST